MKLISAIATTIVSILIIGTVLMPVITDSSSDGEHTIDVVVLAGQSNAQYVPSYMDLSLVNEEFDAPSTNCYYYGYQTSTLVRPSNNIGELTHLNSMNIYSMYVGEEWVIGGEEVPISYTLGKATNNDVLTINVAIGGKPISYFVPDAEGGEYAKTIIDDALSKIPDKYTNVKYAGWMWLQGEADDDTAVSDYIASFDEIQTMYESYGFNTCYMVHTRSEESGNATEAQNTIAATDPNVVMACTATEDFSVASGTLLENNELHYSQAGRIIVGLDVGEAISDNQPTNIRTFAYGGLLIAIPMILIAALILAVVSVIIRKE